MSKQSSILWGFGLAAVIAWAVFVVAASIAAARGVTTGGSVERWGSLAEIQSRWTPQGWAEGCTQASPDLLTMRCFSAGWYYRQTYPANQPLTVEGRVRGAPASAHGRYWAEIKSGTVDPYSNDDILCQSADLHTSGGMGYGIGILLPECYAMDVLPSDNNWHSFRLVYQPTTTGRGCWSFSIDGAYNYQSCGAVGTYIRPKVGCAAVHPGEPNTGQLAECQWGPLTITAGATATPTPTPTPTPRPRAR